MVLLPRLAARTGATVLFAFAERLPRGEGYRIHFLPAPEGLADARFAACVRGTQSRRGELREYRFCAVSVALQAVFGG